MPDKPKLRQGTTLDQRVVLGFRISQPAVIYGLLRHALVTKAPRASVGSALPQSLPVLAVTVAGLSPLVAGRLVEHGDWLGLLTTDHQVNGGWAFALPVVSGSELVAELTLGAGAARQAVVHGSWTELRGTNVGPLGPVSVGVAANRLLFGKSAADVEALAQAVTGGSALAPPLSEVGIAAKLLVGHTVLQGLHAAWSDRIYQALVAVIPPLEPRLGGSIAHLLSLWNGRLSAYMAYVESAEVKLELKDAMLKFAADVQAEGLPIAAPASSLCRDLLFPTGTQFWIAGASAGPLAALSRPDWAEVPGDWQRNVLATLTYFGASIDGVKLTLDVPMAAAPWVLGFREGRAGATFFGILHGVPPSVFAAWARPTAREVGQEAASGRLTERRVTTEGKPLAWAWLPYGDGVATALGAPLSDGWDTWPPTAQTAARPTFLNPAECDLLLGAVGSGKAAHLLALRVTSGLELRGRWDVTEHWSTR